LYILESLSKVRNVEGWAVGAGFGGEGKVDGYYSLALSLTRWVR
jgi:hypothetical protein